MGVLTRVAAECGGSPPTHILPCYPGPLYGLVRHSTAAFRASGISGRPKVRCEIEIRFGAFDAEAAIVRVKCVATRRSSKGELSRSG